MKVLRPFFLVTLLLALVPMAWAAPTDKPPEASLWDEFFDGIVRVLESVWIDSEATAAEISGDEEDSSFESYPTIEPVGSPEAYPLVEPVGSPESYPWAEPVG